MWTAFGSGSAQCGWTSDPAKNRAKYWEDIMRFFTQILPQTNYSLVQYNCFFLSNLPLGNQSVSQKVYLEFHRGIAKFSEKYLTVQMDFVILKFGHKNFVHFCFSDGPLTQSVCKLLSHWFRCLWVCDTVQIIANISVFGWDCPSPV